MREGVSFGRPNMPPFLTLFGPKNVYSESCLQFLKTSWMTRFGILGLKKLLLQKLIRAPDKLLVDLFPYPFGHYKT